MFDAPLEGLYAWVGVAAVSVAVLGVASALPSAPPPEADGAARTVDRVAGGDHPATGEHGLAADRVRITATAISLAGDGGTVTARFGTGTVTPARRDEALARVLKGAPPDEAFASSAGFAAAAERARAENATWRAAPDRLRVRRVHWGDVRVTLVG